MPSILDSFKKQLEEDRKDENYAISETECMQSMNEEEFEEYKKEVDRLREKIYIEEPKKMSTKIENKSYPLDELMEKNSAENGFKEITESELNVTDTPMDNIKLCIRHAKCPYCGAEIISKTPTLYNPFSFKKTTRHTCEKCGSNFVTEYAYPRIVFLNGRGEEITVYFN